MIFGKLMTLTDFANVFTGNNISEMRSLCILKPVLKSMSYGKIISVLEQADLRISRMTRCRISRKESLKFYEYLRGRAICPFMVEHLGKSLAIVYQNYVFVQFQVRLWAWKWLVMTR